MNYRYPVSHSYQDTTYVFDAGSSGLAYRSWTNICSAGVESDGTVLGSRVGDPSNLQLQVPDSLEIPEGSEDDVRTPGIEYATLTTAGFCVSETAGILTWDFKYKAGTWSPPPTSL